LEISLPHILAIVHTVTEQDNNMLQDALLQLIFGSQYCRPVSGRVVIRASNECESAVVGIVHLPNGFQVQEGAAYLASFLHGQCAIGATAIDSGLPDELAGQGVDNVLRGECWYPTSVEGTAIIRFFQAFPETNSWIMFGVSRQRLIMPNLLSNTGHAWFDLCSGEMSQIAAPGDEVGLTHGQLLSTLLVWPDANGAFFVLPAIESTWREVYYNLSLLNAELGAGDITLDEYFSRFNAD